VGGVPTVLAEPARGRRARSLTLRVNDATARPGGVAVVVLRTYSSRPVGQGQLDVTARPRTAETGSAGGSALAGSARAAAGSGPLTLIGHLVFSGNGDVQSVARRRNGAGGFRLAFTSPSGSVNDADGPLAALFFRVAPDLAPGTAIDLALDAAGSRLIDDRGRPILLELRPGVLSVRAAGGPHRLSADGDKVDPGETAELAVETSEQFAIGGGHLVLHYDPSLAAGPPVVRFDQRYGRAAFTADVSTPGTIVVHFEAIAGALNRVPGGLIRIRLPISPAARRGTRSPFGFDREASWLLPFGGRGALPLRFADGEIEIRE
jgi:hypothetical protein